MAPRSAIFLVAVGLLAGCGGQETSRLHPKHRNCTSSGAPPVPVIERAWQDGERYRVRVHLAAEPEECKPVKVRVLLSSTLDSGHKLLSTDGLYATFTDGRAEMVFERSVLHLPPYVARAISFTESGHISAGAERRIRETGDYCARHRPVARCIIEAEALAHRCVRGTAPRGQCPARGYGSRRLRPSTPVEGASFEAVVEDVRETLLGGTQDDIRLDAFTCTPKLVCTATYRRDPREGVLRIRYYVSGSDDGPGCWNSQEHDIVEPPYDRARSPLAPYVQRGNMTGCLHWR